MTDDIHEQLQVIFREAIGPHVELHDDLSADSTDGWDSLAHINLMFAVEEDFQISFGQDEMMRLRNAGDLKALIAHKLGRKPA